MRESGHKFGENAFGGWEIIYPFGLIGFSVSSWNSLKRVNVPHYCYFYRLIIILKSILDSFLFLGLDSFLFLNALFFNGNST